jgi:hypothetical protein
MDNEETDDRTESQKLKDKLHSELEQMASDVHYFRESLLRKYGGEYSCDFPDCRWRWVKVINGVTLAMDQASALDMEHAIIERH